MIDMNNYGAPRRNINQLLIVLQAILHKTNMLQ